MEEREHRASLSSKLGYVDTDLGVLPAEWKVVSVADAGDAAQVPRSRRSSRVGPTLHAAKAGARCTLCGQPRGQPARDADATRWLRVGLPPPDRCLVSRAATGCAARLHHEAGGREACPRRARFRSADENDVRQRQPGDVTAAAVFALPGGEVTFDGIDLLALSKGAHRAPHLKGSAQWRTSRTRATDCRDVVTV